MKPITIGSYRLRNGRTARVRTIVTMNDVRIAIGGIRDAEVEHPAEWTAEDGLHGIQPGPWDLVERLPDPPEESVLTILRREHAAMMTIADSHAAVSKQALQGAQEIEHRIQEMERMEG